MILTWLAKRATTPLVIGMVVVAVGAVCGWWPALPLEVPMVGAAIAVTLVHKLP